MKQIELGLGVAPQRPKRSRVRPKGAAGRDQVIADLHEKRAELIEVGRRIASEIARARGAVTSVDVFEAMRAQGYADKMLSVDPRWMGAVFRPRKGWKRVGWKPIGSNARPVAVWEISA